MAYSYYIYPGTGSQTQFNVAFDYIRREHVAVTVAGSPATFTWVNNSLIQMDTAPANGAAVRVYRVTPLTAPLVDFTDGATLVAADLDTNAKQSIYTQQELYDGQIEGLANVIPDGDKGDIVTSVGATVWTIDTGAVTSAKIADGTIVNTDINASAAIAGSKINPDFGSQNIITSGNATVTSLNGGPLAGNRNRIINGDMRIDQRNAGASVTPTTGQYVVDRWRHNLTVVSKYSVQRTAGGITPPAGFTNYLGITSLSAYTLTGNDSFDIEQIIEGFNISDLNWGTASAIPATLSFWVRSSLTGTFGGSIATANSAIWVMPFSYTIASANTWTYITVPVTAPTATGGTNNDNTGGAFLRFGLGATGTSAGGSNGAWTSAGNYVQPSGTVSVVGTNGATWQITGVQLEPGSTATPFERRSFGQELSLCQRYFEKSYTMSQLPGSTTDGICSGANFLAVDTSSALGTATFKTSKRAIPTVTVYSPTSGAAGNARNAGNGFDTAASGINDITENGFFRFSGSWTSGITYSTHFTASAEL